MPSLAVEHVALRAPIDRHTHRVLRAAVVELVENESRRRFPVVVHAGVPGRGVRHVEDPPLADDGARADVALALVRRARALGPRPVVWLTRPGELTPHDDDLRCWGRSAGRAAASASPSGWSW